MFKNPLISYSSILFNIDQTATRLEGHGLMDDEIAGV